MRALIFLTECVTNEDVFCVGWLQVYLDRQDHNEINLSLTRDIFKYDENEEYLYKQKTNQEFEVILVHFVKLSWKIPLPNRIILSLS